MIAILLLLLCNTIISLYSLDNNINVDKVINTRPRFLFVDPLNEYLSTEVVINRCKEYDVECIPIYSPTTAKNLINSISINDNDDDTLEKIKMIKQSTYPNENISKWLFMNWNKRISIDDDIIIDNNDNIYSDILTKGISQHIIGTLCESDCGLRISELVSNKLNVKTSNGEFEPRRDKYQMQERLKKHLDVINDDINNNYKRKYHVLEQILTEDWKLAKSFIQNLKDYNDDDSFNCVIKPSRGSASLGVFKANNMNEANEIFHKSLGNPGYANGTISDAILVQECVAGKEFVVDTVSSDGIHKCVAVWCYDKRKTNDSPFVYYCTELVQDTDSIIMQEIQEYATLVCDSLNIKYGPCHIEIMYNQKRGPILIEANCGRFHCQDYTSICDQIFDYNQASLTVDSYIRTCNNIDEKTRELADTRFKKVPDRVPSSKTAARIVHLVSFKEGKLKKIHHQDEVYKLQSLMKWNFIYDTKGEDVKKTINLHTVAGWGLLIGNKEIVNNDYNKLLALQETMIEVE